MENVKKGSSHGSDYLNVAVSFPPSSDDLKICKAAENLQKLSLNERSPSNEAASPSAHDVKDIKRAMKRKKLLEMARNSLKEINHRQNCIHLLEWLEEMIEIPEEKNLEIILLIK